MSVLRTALRVHVSVAAALTFITGTASSTEVLFDPPAYVESWELPSDPENLPDYTALAVAQDGSVWVASHTAVLHLIQGAVVGSFDLPSQTNDPATKRMAELADGRLCLLRGDRVLVLGTDGSVQENWSPGTGWLGDIDPNGLVYVAPYAYVNVTVNVFNLSGEVVRTWAIPKSAWGLSVGPDGRVYISYEDLDHYVRIHVWSPEGALLTSWPNVDAFNMAFDIGATGNVFFQLGDDPSRDLAAYSADGIALWSYRWIDPTPDGSCRFPTFFAFAEDATGRVYWVTRDTCSPPPPPYPPYPPRIEIYEPQQAGVIVQPDFADVSYSVDGVSLTGRQMFLWPQGSEHEVAAAETTPIAPGTRRDFKSWSDGGAREHTIVTASSPRGLALDSQTLHFIETVVDSGGTATPSAWMPESSQVVQEARASPGYRFVKWGHPDSVGWRFDDVLDPSWEHTVLEPERWEACFVRRGLALSISASATDPWVNRAEPAHGPRRLYLWAATLDRGISALEADVSGSLAPMSFEPADGVLNIGQGPNLLCAIGGCPIGADAPRLLGSWMVMDEGGDLCLAPSAANDLLVLVRCPNEVLEAFDDFRVVGFSSIGNPCDLGRAGLSVARTAQLAPTRDQDSPALATPFRLSAPAGPSRGAVDFSFGIPRAGRANLRLVDVTGRLVRTLVDGELASGEQRVAWDARDAHGRVVPAGVYFARLEWQGQVQTRKVVHLGR